MVAGATEQSVVAMGLTDCRPNYDRKGEPKHGPSTSKFKFQKYILANSFTLKEITNVLFLRGKLNETSSFCF